MKWDNFNETPMHIDSLLFPSSWFVIVVIHIADFLCAFFFLYDDDDLQVVLTHQFLVRPTNGPTGDKEQNNKKDRTNTTDTATSTTSTNSDTSQQSTPEFSFAETVLQKVGKTLKDVIEQVSKWFCVSETRIFPCNIPNCKTKLRTIKKNQFSVANRIYKTIKLASECEHDQSDVIKCFVCNCSKTKIPIEWDFSVNNPFSGLFFLSSLL